MTVEPYRKKPIEVQMMRWDGSAPRLVDIRTWIVQSGGDADWFRTIEGYGARIWTKLEECWVDCPEGHYLARGLLGEFYPIAPAALAQTFDFVAAP